MVECCSKLFVVIQTIELLALFQSHKNKINCSFHRKFEEILRFQNPLKLMALIGWRKGQSKMTYAKPSDLLCLVFVGYSWSDNNLCVGAIHRAH